MIRQLIKLLKIKKAEGSDLYTTYDIMVKRTYFELSCPTAPNQLKKFIERIPDLFQYRQALLDQLNA